MADQSFKLEVITPDRIVLSDRSVLSVMAPGTEGYLGVLASHAPLMTELRVGRLEFRRNDGSSDKMAITGGFMEVYEDNVTVLADTAELAEEIDVDRAERAVKRAEERISSAVGDIDMERAQAALKRAMNRLNIAKS